MAGSGKADPDDANADAVADWLNKRKAGSSGSETGGLQQQVIEIAPDEADVVALFLSLQTQWRRHAMTGAALGLIYEAVPATAALTGIATTPALFADLQIMESAAMEEMARKS